MIGGEVFERVISNLQAQVDELEVENGALEAQMATGRDKQNGQVHKGFGKLILFGEHFVVYKVPALVGAVAAYTDCQVRVLHVQLVLVYAHALRATASCNSTQACSQTMRAYAQYKIHCTAKQLRAPVTITAHYSCNLQYLTMILCRCE